MNNNKLIVSYQPSWDNKGTVYRQTVKVPSELLTILNSKLNKAIEEKGHSTITDNFNHVYISPLQDGKNYTTNTTSKIIKYELGLLGVNVSRYLLDRNTIVEFY
ncbi:hypothetical protein EFP_140 [Enterococcus phage EF24C]|uniref:Uncharacterized protein n=1 Tax=Enterococcus phage phiEF24C TaxID=442493 RepID=A8E2J2_BPPHE|nr:hypothetical protein EFP_gp140 [Enterococcus phage EF24C]BAF81408.1 hypothetical protein EFP_140 [Enterococcus phage EF24C]